MRNTIASCLVVLALLAAPAMAASQQASDIVGRISTADNEPLQYAHVVLVHLETNRVLVARTNAKGRYHFANVRPDGTYFIKAYAPTGEAIEYPPGRVLLGHVMRRDFRFPRTADMAAGGEL